MSHQSDFDVFKTQVCIGKKSTLLDLFFRGERHEEKITNKDKDLLLVIQILPIGYRIYNLFEYIINFR